MSDYEELKKEMHRYNRAVATKHHEIQKINDELKSIEQEKETAKQVLNLICMLTTSKV